MPLRVLGAAAALALVVLGAALVLRGLVDAVPLVNWNSNEQQALQASGVGLVRVGCLLTGLAGVGLLLAGSWWAGAAIVAGSLALALLVGLDTVWAWLLGLALAAYGFGACLAALLRARRG